MRALGLFSLVLWAFLAAPGLAWEGARCLQAQLNALGYSAGPVDGRIGPSTRKALQAYEKVVGVLPAKRLDAVTAIVHCRQLGLRHPAAKALWPAQEGAFTLLSEPDTPAEYVAQVDTALRGGLSLMRDQYGIAIAAPFVVVVGSTSSGIRKLAAPHRPGGLTDANLAATFQLRCGKDGTGATAFPGLIVICHSPELGDPAKTPETFPYLIAVHEVVHEVQYQLIGHRLQGTVAESLAQDGPLWLIEGTAEAAAMRVVGKESTVPHLALSRVYPGTPPDLRNYERLPTRGLADGTPYVLGRAAAKNLAYSAGGIEKLFEFYELLGHGLAWPAAFEQVFSETPAAFYARWETLVAPE